MTYEQISPVLSIVLNAVSMIVYAQQKDLPHAFYWLLAGLLTFTVTFLFKR